MRNLQGYVFFTLAWHGGITRQSTLWWATVAKSCREVSFWVDELSGSILLVCSAVLEGVKFLLHISYSIHVHACQPQHSGALVPMVRYSASLMHHVWLTVMGHAAGAWWGRTWDMSERAEHSMWCCVYILLINCVMYVAYAIMLLTLYCDAVLLHYLPHHIAYTYIHSQFSVIESEHKLCREMSRIVSKGRARLLL